MEKQRSSGIDILTLAIAAVASAVAAYLTSKVWAGGTLVSAAFTPVIVALIKEALARPVDAVTSLRTTGRATGEQPRAEQAEEGTSPLHPPVTIYGRSNRRWIRVGIVSGLAAFALVVAVFTVPELVTGKSIGRSGDSATTFFGGKGRKSAKEKKKESQESQDKTPAAPDATATPTEDEEPTPTATVAPTVTTAPTPSAAPTVTAVPTATPVP